LFIIFIIIIITYSLPSADKAAHTHTQ